MSAFHFGLHCKRGELHIPASPDMDWLQQLTEEEVVCVRTLPTNAKDLQQIKKLAMDITNNGHRSLDMDHIALLHQQLLGLGADGLDHGLSQELLAVEALDALIQIDTSFNKVSTHSTVTNQKQHVRILNTSAHLLGRPGIAVDVTG